MQKKIAKDLLSINRMLPIYQRDETVDPDSEKEVK